MILQVRNVKELWARFAEVRKAKHLENTAIDPKGLGGSARIVLMTLAFTGFLLQRNDLKGVTDSGTSDNVRDFRRLS